MDDILQPVQARVFRREFAGESGNIHARDFLRAIMPRMKRETARVRETVQYGLSLDERCNRGAVLLLVEEEARLLAFLDIHPEVDAVLHHLHAVGNCAVHHACQLLQALQAANRHIAALIDALWMHFFHQRVHHILLEALHAQRQALQHQYIAKAVHNQRGQAVALRENQSAGAQVRERAPVIDSFLDTAEDERAVNRLVVQAHDAQGNLALRIVKRLRQEFALTGIHRHDVAGGEIALDARNIAAEHPRMSAVNPFFFAGDENRIGHMPASLCLMRRRCADERREQRMRLAGAGKELRMINCADIERMHRNLEYLRVISVRAEADEIHADLV